MLKKLKLLLKNIKILIENILYTFIFCVTKNNAIQKKLFALYLSKVTISKNEVRLIPKLDYHVLTHKKHDPNFGITFQDDIAKELFISTKKNIRIKKQRHIWHYPVEYPPKLKLKNIKDSPLLNIIPENEKEVYVSDFIRNYTNNSRANLTKLAKLKYQPGLKIPKNKKILGNKSETLLVKKLKVRKSTENTIDILAIKKPKVKKLVEGKFDIVMSKKMRNLLKDWPVRPPKKRIIKHSNTWYDFFFGKRVKYTWDSKLQKYVVFKQKEYTWDDDLGRYVFANKRSWIKKKWPIADWLYNYKLSKLKPKHKNEKLISPHLHKKEIINDHWLKDYIANKKAKRLPNNVLHNCEEDINTLFYTRYRFEIGEILAKKVAWAEAYKKSLLPLSPKKRANIIKLDNPEWDFVKLTKGKPITPTQYTRYRERYVPWTELKVTRWKWLSDHLFSVKLYKKQCRKQGWIHQHQNYKAKKKLDIALKEQERLINIWKTKQARKQKAKDKYLYLKEKMGTSKNKAKDVTLLNETQNKNIKNNKAIYLNNEPNFLANNKTIDHEAIINALTLNRPKRSKKLPNIIYTIKGPRNRLEMLKKLPKQNPNIVDIREPFTSHQTLPNGRRKKIPVFRDTRTPNETAFRYFDLKDRESTIRNFKSDQGLAWREIWNNITNMIDQYFYTIPIFIIFLFIHWTLAEVILAKFKCQQHYKWNTLLFTSGFLSITYIYLIFFKLPEKGLFCYGTFPVSNYWPLYSTLYIWWFFLITSFFVTFIFTLFTPKTPYLRGKNIVSHGDMIFNLLPSLIGLFMIPIVAQRRLPFWPKVEILFLENIDKLQYHFGYTYFFFTWILMGLTGVAFFYYIVTINSYNKYKASKDKSYIGAIIYLLFSEKQDDTDLWPEVGGDTAVPYYLVQYLEDFASNREEYEVPEGYFYHSVGKNKFMVGWQASYSKKIFLTWYVTMAIYYTLIYQLYFIIEWPTLLVLIFFFWLILAISYLIFIKYVLGFNIIRKKRHKIMFLFFIFFLCFIFIFFYKDFLFFLGVK